MLSKSDLAYLTAIVRSKLEEQLSSRKVHQAPSGEKKSSTQPEDSLSGTLDYLYLLHAKLLLNSKALGSSSPERARFGEESIEQSRGISASCLQPRTSSLYEHDLRQYWFELSYAANRAIEYTYLESPTQLDHSQACTLLAASIDRLRCFFLNIKKDPMDHGLYPFEPLKEMLAELRKLGWQKVGNSDRAKTRSTITESWHSVREPLLTELERSTPGNPISRFLESPYR